MPGVQTHPQTMLDLSTEEAHRRTISRRTGLCLMAGALLDAGCASPLAVPRRRELVIQGDLTVDVIVDGSGPAVVLLPSSLRDSEDFDDIAHIIAAQGFQVLRPQPRGMGQSSPPLQGMTLETLADDVALTIKRLSQGPAVVVGHAFGHWVARVLDMNHPRLVRGVVVLGGSAKVFPAGMAEALAIGSDPSKPEKDRIDALNRSMFAPGNDSRVWLAGWHPELRAAYRLAGQFPPKDRWFNAANTPILDLQGAQDAWRPLASRNELKDVLGDKITVAVIANAGHAMVPEQPKAVSEAIVAWIRALKP
jgi:pimeloyl-ACP methyl ester carboxylesterase